MHPAQEAIELATSLPNVWLDCSGTDAAALRLVRDAGLADRLLFATDLPICLRWHGQTAADYVRERLLLIRSTLGPSAPITPSEFS